MGRTGLLLSQILDNRATIVLLRMLIASDSDMKSLVLSYNERFRG